MRKEKEMGKAKIEGIWKIEEDTLIEQEGERVLVHYLTLGGI